VPPQDAGSIPGVTYRYGIPEGAGAVTATLKIRANFVRTPIWNVVTVIPGAIDPEHVRTSNLTRHSARSFSRSPLPNSTCPTRLSVTVARASYDHALCSMV
jgi:hypothetical protein